MMDCKQQGNALAKLREGTLTQAERRAMDEHACDCPGCSRELAALERLVGLVGQAHYPKRSAGQAARRVLQQLHEENADGSTGNAHLPRWWQRRLSVPLPVATSFMLLLGLSLFLRLPATAPPPGAGEHPTAQPHPRAPAPPSGAGSTVLAGLEEQGYREVALYLPGEGLLYRWHYHEPGN